MSDGFFTGLGAVGDAIAQAEGSAYNDPPEGRYKFEVLGANLKKGNKNDPDALALIIKYDLEGDGDKSLTWSEYLSIPNVADGRQMTEQEGWSLNSLKTRFLSLGVEDSKINSAGPDDIEGVTGTLEIRKNKKGYVQARNVKASVAAPAAAPAQAVARPATRKAAPKAAPSEGSQPTEAPAPQRPTQAIGNPFAK